LQARCAEVHRPWQALAGTNRGMKFASLVRSSVLDPAIAPKQRNAENE